MSMTLVAPVLTKNCMETYSLFFQEEKKKSQQHVIWERTHRSQVIKPALDWWGGGALPVRMSS